MLLSVAVFVAYLAKSDLVIACQTLLLREAKIRGTSTINIDSISNRLLGSIITDNMAFDGKIPLHPQTGRPEQMSPKRKRRASDAPSLPNPFRYPPPKNK